MAGTLIFALQVIEQAVPVPVVPDVEHVLVPDAVAALSIKSAACFVAAATNAGPRAALDGVVGTPIVNVPVTCCTVAEPDGPPADVPPPVPHDANIVAAATKHETRSRTSIVTSIPRGYTRTIRRSDEP